MSLPGWQALSDELADSGLQVVTIALDAGGADAVRPFVPESVTLPVLVDVDHVTDRYLGFRNVPMAVWVDEDCRVVRPAHLAHPARPPSRSGPAPEGDDRLSRLIRTAQSLPTADDYPDELRSFAEHGGDSPHALSPEAAIASSHVRSPEEAEAVACFELGRHLWASGDRDGARRWWRRSHELDPEDWASKRQAWTFETTPDGATSDLLQPPTDAYGTGWLEDVERLGPDRYYET